MKVENFRNSNLSLMFLEKRFKKEDRFDEMKVINIFYLPLVLIRMIVTHKSVEKNMMRKFVSPLK